MNALKLVMPALALTIGLGGCALFGIETGYRSLTIRNHQFVPAEVRVPSGEPFVLTIDGFDDKDLAISAPDLGITLLRIPATPEDPSPLSGSSRLPTRHARLPLGPLEPGRYVISCTCHGTPSEAVIIAW